MISIPNTVKSLICKFPLVRAKVEADVRAR
jgi:hypothetical protein